MSTHNIFTAATFGKWKQQARRLKRSTGITHAEALEQVARSKGFTSWHHLTQESKLNLVSETACRSGLVVAYDIKDAMDNWRSDSLYVEDYRAPHFCYEDVFERYKESDEEERLTPPLVDDSYRREFDDWYLENVFFFRYCGTNLPSSPHKVLPLLRERCFFPPMYIWHLGKFLDPFRDLAVDGVLQMG